MHSVSLFTKLFLSSAGFVIVKMTEQQDQRICIKFCFQLGKTSSETIQMMQKAFGKMTCNENVSEFYDRLILLKSGAQAALEDKYDIEDLLLAPLNDCALESFIRGFTDGLSRVVENRNPNTIEAALKYAIEYESRHQLNPQFPHNNFYNRNFAQPAYSGMRDRSPSPHVRFAVSPERNRPNEYRQNSPRLNRRNHFPTEQNYPSSFSTPIHILHIYQISHILITQITLFHIQTITTPIKTPPSPLVLHPHFHQIQNI